ncbi:hypothetical protein [Rurimicrobium arvi]|uniref:Uncharacterized protein n=1 Tax=Rurimicrobium arvi TaxID=2049916 RepID=A0ABP8N0Z1_9BACT
MKKTHQVTLTPLTKDTAPEPDFQVCKKCGEKKEKDAFRKANLWRAKVCIECDYATKKAKTDALRKEKDIYGFF